MIGCRAAVFACVATATVVSPDDQRPQAREGVLIVDAYASSDFPAIARLLTGNESLTQLQDRLDAAVADGDGGPRRRLLAAAVAVEAAQLRGFQEMTGAVEVIEWACTLLRTHDAPGDAERIWFLASLAIFEGLASSTSVVVHADHALRRFPAEPRFELALAVGTELATFPDPREKGRLSARIGTQYDRLVTRLSNAARHESVRAEARVRLGFTLLRDGRPEQALEALDGAAGLTDEPFLVYLAHLFRGRALEKLDRLDDAVAAYRAAVAAVPGAQSAELALATALMKGAGRLEASERAKSAVMAERVADPWSGYGQGDLRLWPVIRQQLREAVQ